MPTLNDIIRALIRAGVMRWLIVGFGCCCMVVLNCFKSNSPADAAGNVIFGVLILAAMFAPMKKE